MENEQLIERVQILLLGMEERTNTRLDKMDARLDKIDVRLDKIDTRLDSLEGTLGSVAREVKLNNELLSPFIRWSHSVEDEIIRLSAQLQDVQARLKRLENPQPQ